MNMRGWLLAVVGIIMVLAGVMVDRVNALSVILFYGGIGLVGWSIIRRERAKVKR